MLTFVACALLHKHGRLSYELNECDSSFVGLSNRKPYLELEQVLIGSVLAG